ncbi:MAG: DnaB-like helicase C-terminal domain-containing protein [Lentihominibacter sp.]|jgi:replicative DNA helicase
MIEELIRYNRQQLVITVAGRPGMGRTKLIHHIITKAVEFAFPPSDILLISPSEYFGNNDMCRCTDDLFHIDDIVEKCMEYADLKLIVIDDLEHIDVGFKAGSDEEKYSVIMRKLRKVAKAFDCLLIAVAKLGREIEKRPDRRPLLSDLNPTISLYSDVVILLYRDGYYDDEISDEDDWLEVFLVKNKSGSTGHITYSSLEDDMTVIDW